MKHIPAADIGGVLGLFLGASLFTILEFFQFILYSILKHCFGYKYSKITNTRAHMPDPHIL